MLLVGRQLYAWRTAFYAFRKMAINNNLYNQTSLHHALCFQVLFYRPTTLSPGLQMMCQYDLLAAMIRRALMYPYSGSCRELELDWRRIRLTSHPSLK